MKTNGPGKYDKECTAARESAGASGAVLIIFEGKDGSGFSVQGPSRLVFGLPNLLEFMAKEIRKDISK